MSWPQNTRNGQTSGCVFADTREILEAINREVLGHEAVDKKPDTFFFVWTRLLWMCISPRMFLCSGMLCVFLVVHRIAKKEGLGDWRKKHSGWLCKVKRLFQPVRTARRSRNKEKVQS